MSATVSSCKGLSLSLQVHSSTVSIKTSHLYEMLGPVTGGPRPAKKLATCLVSPIKNLLTGPGRPKLWDPPFKPSASSLLPAPSDPRTRREQPCRHMPLLEPALCDGRSHMSRDFIPSPGAAREGVTRPISLYT